MYWAGRRKTRAASFRKVRISDPDLADDALIFTEITAVRSEALES